jgi:hypothetical protein
MNNSGSGTHFAAIIYRWLLKSLHFLLPLLAGAGDLWWFCGTYLRQRIRELTPSI